MVDVVSGASHRHVQGAGLRREVSLGAVLLAEFRDGRWGQDDHPVELQPLGPVHGGDDDPRGLRVGRFVGETAVGYQAPQPVQIERGPPG